MSVSSIRLGAAAAIVAGALAASPAQADARPAPRSVEIVVAGAHGRADVAARLVRRLGGRVHRRLHIIDGFTARVPRRAVRRVAGSGAVRSLSRNTRLHVSSTTDPGADAAAATTSFLRTATGAARLDAGQLAGAGVDVAVVDSGAVPVGSLGRLGALFKAPTSPTSAACRRSTASTRSGTARTWPA